MLINFLSMFSQKLNIYIISSPSLKLASVME